MTKPKTYWRIEIMEGTDVVFRRYLSGNMSDDEIALILQRLACRKLTADEIVAGSLRRPKRSGLLDCRFESTRTAKRSLVWLATFPKYIASKWGADEPREPEIGLRD
jgi:hypothetical protein